MIIAVKRAVKGVHEKVINYLQKGSKKKNTKYTQLRKNIKNLKYVKKNYQNVQDINWNSSNYRFKKITFKNSESRID